MGTIALNQIINSTKNLEQAVNVMYEFLYYQHVTSFDDGDFSFDQKGWEKCLSGLMNK